MVKSLYFLSILSLCFSVCYSQDLTKMNIWQDSLLKLSTQMYSSVNEAERLNTNFTFVKALVSSLKETNAFKFNFDKLNQISILNSPDGNFRIFSWHIPLNDGSHLYYGAIQHKDANIKLTPLLDKTFEIAEPNKAISTASAWYGARYYDIIPLSPTQYVLLGWKGHHSDYSQKVIEIITFDPDVRFGALLFSDQPDISRRIFNYTKQASMYLKYNIEKSRLEFDHIVPIDDELIGDYRYYGPDLTYDGYILEGRRLKYVENIELQNDLTGKENQYIDLSKKVSGKKSGIK